MTATATTKAAHPISPVLLEQLAGRLNTSGLGVLTVREVFTGRTLVELPEETPGDAIDMVDRARKAQKAWGALAFRHRAKVVSRYFALARREKDTLLDVIQAETGKSRWEAFIEFLEPALTMSYYRRHGKRILGTARCEAMVPFLVNTVEMHHPVGVVGVIAPWNFPYALGISDSLTALLAGNAVILKPDVQTTLDALHTAALLEEAGLPADVFQVLAGPGETVGATLVEHADYIAFTGSVATGRRVAERTAGRLVGCSLEMGGKNPMIVLPDADLPSVARSAVRACFMHAGQVCMAIEKIFVHHDALDEFLNEFLKATRGLVYATAYDFAGTFGSLTNAAQLAKVDGYVSRAVACGAQAVTGGRARPDIGPYFYEPTILTGVTPAMDMYHDEVFGPVVAVFGYETLDEAVDLANAGPLGLNASVCGRNTKAARHVGERIRAGTVNVNEGFAAAFGSIGAQSGGMGHSGLGRRHGPEGILKYTEPQTIAIQHLALHDPPGWLPRQLTTTITTYAYGVLNRLQTR